MEAKERRIILNNEENNSISIVELKVNDKDSLRELRDGLLKYGNIDKLKHGNINKERSFLDNYILLHSEDAFTLYSLLKSGYFDYGNFLIHQYVTSRDEDDCDYRKEVIYCTHLNSILLFTSLLGELDVVDYCKDSNLIKQFIGNGIIKCSNFEDIWQNCSNSLVNFGQRIYREKDFVKLGENFHLSFDTLNLFNEIKKEDLLFFRKALKHGIIAYDVVEEYSTHSNEARFRGFNSKDVQQININTAILLGDKKSLKKIK